MKHVNFWKWPIFLVFVRISFWWYETFELTTDYEMNPLEFFICAIPTILALPVLFYSDDIDDV